MTNEEAVKWFTDNFPDYVFEYPIEQHMAYSLAIEAIKKQIPMKPAPKELAEEQHFKVPTYITPCGNCGEPINFLHSYCPWCGQRILETTDDNL